MIVAEHLFAGSSLWLGLLAISTSALPFLSSLRWGLVGVGHPKYVQAEQEQMVLHHAIRIQ